MHGLRKTDTCDNDAILIIDLTMADGTKKSARVVIIYRSGRM